MVEARSPPPVVLGQRSIDRTIEIAGSEPWVCLSQRATRPVRGPQMQLQRLLLGVVLDGMPAEFASEAGLPVAAERQFGELHP